jgi:hypothetical protein
MVGSQSELPAGSPPTAAPAPGRLAPRLAWAKSRLLADRLTPLSLILLGVVFAVVLATTLRSPLKDDVAWLLHVARDMLAGKRLYVDDVEINPPLIIWLLMLPAEIARLTGLSAETLTTLLSAGLIMGCAYWSAALLRGYAALFAAPAPVFAAIGVVLLTVPGVEFGQREHLLIACALPYLCLFAQRLNGRAPSRPVAIACGAVAALGCALKPHYLIGFAALEGVALARGLRPWRPETIAAALVLALYAAAVVLIYPVYFSFIIPLTLDLYGASDVSFTSLLLQSHNLLLGEAIIVLLIGARFGRKRGDPLLLTLAVFAGGAIVAYLVQDKDWFYHRLPATIVVVLALAYWTADVLLDRSASGARKLAGLAIAACALGAFGGAAADRLEPRLELALGEQRALENRIEDLIAESHATRYMAFSQSLSPGFPVVDETGVTWTSRFDSMWLLRGWQWRIDSGARPAAWPVKHWIISDFIRGCPELVVVDDRDGMDYLGVLLASPHFAAAWSHYRPLADFNGVRVFRLADGAAMHPESSGGELRRGKHGRVAPLAAASPCRIAPTSAAG